MRRPALLLVFLVALALPATAFALHAAPGDGTLVVKDATGPQNKPVVALDITGAVIGHVSGNGRIKIDPGVDGNAPEVTGYDSRKDSTTSDTAQVWYGTDFKFRAVGGHWTILIYGSDVDVFAIGKGTVTLTGLVDNPKGDGTFSTNGQDFRSLPGTPVQKPIGLTAVG